MEKRQANKTDQHGSGLLGENGRGNLASEPGKTSVPVPTTGLGTAEDGLLLALRTKAPEFVEETTVALRLSRNEQFL